MYKVKVTDPCYVISQASWDALIERASILSKDVPDEEWSDIHSSLVNAYLKEKTGEKWSCASSTGAGDWSNSIDGKEFFADSGMVCVVPASFNENASEAHGAELEFDDNKINVYIDWSSNDPQRIDGCNIVSVAGKVNGHSMIYNSFLGSDDDQEWTEEDEWNED